MWTAGRKVWASKAARRRDPGHKLMRIARNRVRELVRGKRSSSNLIGCTRAQLVAHIERQFTAGMTWTNYGEWEMDHIVPLACYRSGQATIEQVAHYLNLRPLWREDNAVKGGDRQHLL